MGRLMLKAVCILVGLLAIGLSVLQFRQESLELRYRTAQLHREIQKSQSTLWRQQVAIAEFTSPKVILPQAGERDGDVRTSAATDADIAGARE